VISARRFVAADRAYFLVSDIGDGYGTCRSVVTLANRLAESRRVEIISLRRTRRPGFRLDDRVVVTYLDGGRPSGPDDEIRGWRRYLLRRALRSRPPGVLISTEPRLHAAASRHAPRHLITIAHDHHSLAARRSSPDLRRLTATSGRPPDALVALTEPDRDAYRMALADARTLVEAIPNAVPWTVDRFVTPQAKVVVSAGRLEPVRGFDRLIEAYDLVAHANPDWQFHIYGEGSDRTRLERMIADRRLEDRVRLRGYAPRFEEILASSSVFALASRHEGLPLVLVEAMSKGLPLVCFDVSPGPAQLVEDGVNGWLVEDGDVSGFSTALFELVKDSDLRLRMGAASQARAHQYDIGQIAAKWEELFARLSRRRAAGG
jgi:glycosyltransferase involved in cell wall biosynthesis